MNQPLRGWFFVLLYDILKEKGGNAMKGKKVVKTVLAVLLISGVLFVVDMFLGNPISWGIVSLHSRSYLNTHYPEQNLYVEDIYHDWYSGGGYDVTAASETSPDTRFQLKYNRLGFLEWDGYDFTVASGRQTLSRIHEEYFQMVNAALEPLEIDMACLPGLSTVDEYTGKAYPLAAGIDMRDLTLDGDYDGKSLGAEYGYLSISMYVAPEDLTANYAAKQLLRIKNALDEQKIGFVFVDLFLSVRESKDAYESLGISGITRADLESENLAARLEQMRLEQLDYWYGTEK